MLYNTVSSHFTKNHTLLERSYAHYCMRVQQALPPVQHGKQKLLELIQKEKVKTGEVVVPSSYQTFRVDSNSQIQEKTVHYSAKYIPLVNISFKSTSTLALSVTQVICISITFLQNTWTNLWLKTHHLAQKKGRNG